jgi:hypothetical protein
MSHVKLQKKDIVKPRREEEAKNILAAKKTLAAMAMLQKKTYENGVASLQKFLHEKTKRDWNKNTGSWFKVYQNSRPVKDIYAMNENHALKLAEKDGIVPCSVVALV